MSGDRSPRSNPGAGGRVRGMADQFRAELLRRLAARREPLAAAIVDGIFEEVAEYRAMTGPEPRQRALATVREVLGCTLRLLAEERVLDQEERGRLREIGGARAERGVLLESVHAAVRSGMERSWRELLAETAGLPLSADGQMAVGRLALDVFRAVGEITVLLDAGYLERRSQRLQRRERAQAEVIGEVLRGDFSDEEEVIARATEVGLDLSRPVGLLLVAAPARADEDLVPRSAAAAIARRVAGAIEAGAESDPAHVRLLLPGQDPQTWPATLDLIAQVAAEERVLVLAQPPVDGPLGLKQAYQRAVARLPLARRVFIRRLVVPVSDLDVYSLLQGAPADERREFMREVLGDVLDLPSAQAVALVETLGALFDSGGRLGAAATRLNLHVNTVKQRVRRLETLTGLRVDVSGERLRLELALHLARMAR